MKASNDIAVFKQLVEEILNGIIYLDHAKGCMENCNILTGICPTHAWIHKACRACGRKDRN